MDYDMTAMIIRNIVVLLTFFGAFVFYIVNAISFFQQLSYKKKKLPQYNSTKLMISMIIFIILTVVIVVAVVIIAILVGLVALFFETM